MSDDARRWLAGVRVPEPSVRLIVDGRVSVAGDSPDVVRTAPYKGRLQPGYNFWP